MKTVKNSKKTTVSAPTEVAQAVTPEITANDAVSESHAAAGTQKVASSFTKNRRVNVAMWLVTLPDGKTQRVQQVLDSVVIFKDHPELVKSMNAFREETFGETGKVFDTRRVDIPQDDSIVVHVGIFNSNTGVLLGRKALTGNEAFSYMANIRQEVSRKREVWRASNNSDEFGTSLADAMTASGVSGNSGNTGTPAQAAVAAN